MHFEALSSSTCVEVIPRLLIFVTGQLTSVLGGPLYVTSPAKVTYTSRAGSKFSCTWYRDGDGMRFGAWIRDRVKSWSRSESVSLALGRWGYVLVDQRFDVFGSGLRAPPV
ncbi:hypothetical protein BaRGS_00037346 [Batillaria attramentaria]|uniref:Uncharacterized protein n=1 Tax=Batillaria attramentaria TaxID=370345 RepID=A0ABD0J9N9_9CAEN